MHHLFYNTSFAQRIELWKAQKEAKPYISPIQSISQQHSFHKFDIYQCHLIWSFFYQNLLKFPQNGIRQRMCTESKA